MEERVTNVIPIEVDPSELFFEGITPGVLYVMTFSIRNASFASERIRIKAPKSNNFALNYTPTGVIAPGIEIRAEVECQLPEGSTESRFMDSINILMGEYTLEVPLIATKNFANIVFDPFINLGYVSEGQLVQGIVQLYNQSREVDGEVTLLPPPNSRLHINPSKLTIGPGAVEDVNISFEGAELGPYRQMIEIETSGSFESQYLDVSVMTVDQKLTLLSNDNQGILENVNFGSLYYGQEKIVKGFLVNTGPQQISFQISYSDDEDPSKANNESSGESKSQGNIPAPDKLLNMTPRQGIIKPFSQVEVTMKFTPDFPPPAKGFVSQFNAETKEKRQFARKAFIDCVEMNQRLTLSMEGDAKAPDVTVKPGILRFGNCPVNDRRDILINLENKSELRTPYEFSSLANFKITPNRGILEANQVLSVIASFTPSQLGVFKNGFKISLCEGLDFLDVKVVAESDDTVRKDVIGGIDKIPEHFQRMHKFVDPEEIFAQRQRKRTGKLDPAFLKGNQLYDPDESVEHDKIYEDDNSTAVSVSSKHPFKMKKVNDAHYNDYLVQSSAKRQQKREDATKRLMMKYQNIDPNNIMANLDFEYDNGLEEPNLRVPRGGEALWTVASVDGKKLRPALDENRLIQKKFPAQPSTQAEMRDCTSELGPDALSMVSASHKVLNFGRVCVGSVTTKSFSVTNELEAYIAVKVEDFANELKCKPDQQILPGGAVAGFDMTFSTKTLGSYQKGFVWKLNGHHAFKVKVVAEVVPIELEMSESELHFSFPEDSVDDSMTKDIRLKNLGNGNAEFLWGSGGAFECKPEKGSINPGQVAIITVTWTPREGKRNEEELGLHVPGGIDQTLVVTGRLNPTKLAFEKVKLPLGTVAVGSERTFKAKLKNTSGNPGVFFLDMLDEKLGIRVEPDRGLVPAGESVTVEIKVIPKQVMSYDNAEIYVNVRGGKSLRLTFSGESIVPKVVLSTNEINIPNIAVGSEFRFPVSVTNSSEIAATLILDLKKYPDFRPTLREVPDGNADPERQLDKSNSIIELIDDKATTNNSMLAPNTWKITLAAKSTLKAFLLFKPTSEKKKIQFNLPMNIQGIDNDKSLQADVKTSSKTSRLGISSNVIDFGDCVVSRDPMNRASYFSEVHFKNLDLDTGFSFEIRERGGNTGVGDVQPTFFISPTRGDLAPSQKTSIRLTFQPQERGKFVRILDVYVTNQPSPDIPYFSIVCKGSGIFARLGFSTSEITLPTVPLEINSRAEFDIINYGYSNCFVKHKLGPSLNGKVNVTYPDGAELSTSKESIRCVVTAKFNVPTSWSGTIEFLDDNGEKFPVEVAGCTDNSVLTNSDFIANHKKSFSFIGLDNHPPLYLLKSQIQKIRAEDAKRKEALRKARQAARSGHAADTDTVATGDSKMGKEPKETPINLDVDEYEDDTDASSMDPSAQFNDDEGKFTLKWLNKNVMEKQFDVSRFPQCVLENDGEIVLHCIEQVSGRKLTDVRKAGEEPQEARAGTAPSSRNGQQEEAPKERVDPMTAKSHRLLKKYRLLVNFLTAMGGLVTHLNPIYMLDMDHFMIAQEHHTKLIEGSRLTPKMLDMKKEVWKATWLEKCKFAWMEVLFQTIRVFVMSRIDYHQLIHLPGVTGMAPHHSSDDGANDKDKKGGKKAKKGKESLPAEFKRSNIYSTAETAILAWVSYHLNHVKDLKDEGNQTEQEQAFGLKKRAIDFEGDMGDIFAFCQLFHSHTPEISKYGGSLCGYTNIPRTARNDLYEKFATIMDEYQLTYEASQEEMSCSNRTLLLMTTHLFLNLPNLIPKANIEFRGTLGLPVKKTIELRNPSKKPVKYMVTLTGSKDFSLSAHAVDIPPNGHVDYVVTLNSRFYETSHAKIYFWGVKQEGVGGRTIIFSLESNMITRNPVHTEFYEMSCFEMDTKEIVINSPFDRDASFPLKLIYHHTPLSVDEAIKGKEIDSTHTIPMESRGGGDENEDYELEENFRMPFWVNEGSIQIAPHGSQTLVLNMLPFIMGVYKCHVVMCDKRVGEFCYEIILTVGLPKPTEALSMKSTCGESIQRLLQIQNKNVLFEKALANVIDVRVTNTSKKAKARTLAYAMLASPFDNAESGTSLFNLWVGSGYFKMPNSLGFASDYNPGVMQATGGSSKPSTSKKVNKTDLYEAGELDSNAANTVPLQFGPDKPGAYDSTLILSSKFNRFDMRIFEISAMVTMPHKKLSIEFKGPANHKLEQEISIMNESDEDWNLTANVQGRGFTGPKSLSVPKRNKAQYKLHFTGASVGNYEGTLQFKNSHQGESPDHFEYDLVGVAEAPLAQDHLHFRCKARTQTNFSISLLPTGKRTEAKTGEKIVDYDVSTDLQYIYGPDKVNIPLSGGEYKFSVFCPMSGVMSGSMSFTDGNSGNTIWYTVDIEIVAPTAESVINVETAVRSAVAVEISLINPIKEELTFTVKIDGDGVFGDTIFTIPALGNEDDTPKYELVYSPLLPGQSQGKISFSNEKVGEIWYVLNLNAMKAPIKEVDMVECMLGAQQRIEIALENPLATEVLLEPIISDPQHFVANQKEILLQPYQQGVFELYFRPSSLNEIRTASVTVGDEDFGILEFQVSGKGLLPGVMPLVNMTASLDEFRSQVIPFRNAFSMTLPISISLNKDDALGVDDDQEDVFKLLMKSNEIVLAPNAISQISLSFAPSHFGEYGSVLQIRSNVGGRSLTWAYPVRGMVEAGSPQYLDKLKTPCKTSTTRECLVYLKGLPLQDAESTIIELSNFASEINCETHSRQFQRALRVDLLAVQLLEEEDIREYSAYYAIRVRILFEPLRAVSGDAEIVIECKHIGRWKAQLEVEATDAAPDDIVQMIAPVGGNDFAKFRLSNRFLGLSHFDAYFTKESSPHFKVSPTNGVLAPYGTNGTEFTVNFSPVVYGTKDIGNLIISTEDAQWTYEIQGSYPDVSINKELVISKVGQYISGSASSIH
jgi:hypothetical protein